MGLLGPQVTHEDLRALAVLEFDGREPESTTDAVRSVWRASQLVSAAVALATRLEQRETLSLVGLHAVAVELVHPFAVQASGGGISA